MFRFIDDLAAINDGGEFENSFHEIYPPELELKKENIGNTEGSFLDLFLEIEDNKFSMNLYDKRDDFPFSIVRMPYLNSNLPSKMFYSAFGAEILRTARTTSTLNDFISNSKRLLKRMKKQGGNMKSISKTLSKTFGRHFESFHKFYSTSIEFVDSIVA